MPILRVLLYPYPCHVQQNHAYKADAGNDQDEIYLYGQMAFGTRQAWQLTDSSLTLMDHVAEGKFAAIYKATWRHDGKQETVVAKMLKGKSSRIFFFLGGGTNCIVPLGFLPWEIRAVFPGATPAATELRYPTYGACWVF